MKRRDLQALCKRHGLPAGGSNAALAARLADVLPGAGAAAGAAADEVVVVPATKKGCLKTAAGGTDLGETKKVSFVLQEEGSRGRSKGKARWGSVDAEAGAGGPSLRRSRRRNSLSLGDANAEAAEEVADPVPVDTKRERKSQQEEPAVSAQVGVSRRVTRRSTSSSSVSPDSAEAAAAVPDTVASKRSGRRKAETCEPADVEAPVRIKRSRAATAAAAAAAIVNAPIVVENKRRTRRAIEDVQPDVVELGPPVLEVPRNDAPVTRTLRNRAVQVSSSASAAVETHAGQKLEDKRRPGRPPTGRNQHLASSAEEEDPEKVVAPSKRLPLRQSGRNNPEASSADSETNKSSSMLVEASNPKGEDVVKQPTVKEPARRSTRKPVVSAMLEEEENNLVAEKCPEAHIRRSRRNSVVSITDSKGDTEEAQSAKSNDMAKQARANEPVSRLTRKSIIPAVLEEEDKYLIAEKSREEHVRRSKRKSVVPVKDSKAFGEENQNAKGKDVVEQPAVKEPFKRSTRRSVASAMLQEEDTSLIAHKNPEAQVRTLKQKSIVPVSDCEETQNAKSKDTAKQPRANEPVSRSTRKSIVSAVLEEEVKDLIAEKSREEHVRRSKRKSAVPVKDSKAFDEENQNAKGKDVVEQPAVKEPVKRSTRRSVVSTMLVEEDTSLIAHKSPEAQARRIKRKSIVPVKDSNGDGEETHTANELVSRSTRKSIISAVLEEKGRYLIAEKSPEERVRRSKRKSIVPDKDNKGVGEETQNAKGKDVVTQPAVKEPVRRSTRRSVASAILEEEDKNLIAHRSPEAQVRTLKRKSVVLVKDNEGDHEETQNAKSEDVVKQLAVKEPVRRSIRESVASDMLEKEHNDLIAAKKPEAHDKIDSKGTNHGKTISKGRPAKRKTIVPEEVISVEEAKCEDMVIMEAICDRVTHGNESSSRGQEICQVNATGEEFSSGPLLVTPNEETSMVQSTHNVIAGSESVDAQNPEIYPSHEDMVIREAICDTVTPANESSSRGQEICQVNATGKEFSSGPLLVTPNEETSIVQSTHNVIAGSECVDAQDPEMYPSHGRESSDKSKQTQEYYDIQTDDGLLTGTSIGELDQSSGITELLQHNGIVSEDKMLRDIGDVNFGDKSIQIVKACSDEVRLDLLNTSFGRSTTGAIIGDAEALPMVESPTVNDDIKQSDTVVSPINSTCCDGITVTVTGPQFAGQKDIQGVSTDASESAPPIADSKQESHSVEQSIQAAGLGKCLSKDIKQNPLSPNIQSNDADTDRILPSLLDTAKRSSSEESRSFFGLDFLFAEEHKGSSSRNDIDTVVEVDYGSKPSACVTPSFCMKSDCGMECENVQPLGHNAVKTVDVGQGVAQEEFIAEDESNNEYVATEIDRKTKSNYEAVGLYMKSDCILAEKNTRLVADNHDDEQAVIKVNQGVLQESTIEKPSLCSAAPESKHECRLPEEAGLHSIMNKRCSSQAEHSPLVLQSLFSHESLDTMECGALAYGTSREESDMSGGKNVSNAGTAGNPSFDSAVSEHKGAFFEEVVHTTENLVGTCPSNPKELLMELQSMSSMGNIKESDLDNLTLPLSAFGGDESTIIDKHVKVHSGSNLSQLESNDLVDESIQCSNTEVLHQGHSNQCNEYSTEEQVASRHGTYDTTEAATVKFTESAVNLLPVEERSGIHVRQLNSMLESAEAVELSPSCNEDVRVTSDKGSAGIAVYEKFLFGDKSDSRVNTLNIYAETCPSNPRELLKELQSSSNETTEHLDPCDNLAFSDTEREGDESTICHVENLVDTVLSSESDMYLDPNQDFSRDEGKQVCMSVSLHDDKEGFLKSNYLKDTSAYLSEDTHNIERDTITEEVLCEERKKREPMQSSNCDFLHENSHSERNGIFQSSDWMHIDEINPKLSSCDSEVLCQDHVEECHEVNEDEVTPAVLEKDMSEAASFERMESTKMLGGEGEEYNFSCDENTGGTFYTGSVNNNMFELHEAHHLDSWQKQDALEFPSVPKCPEESTNCQGESVLGPGTCYTGGQKSTNESSTTQLTSHIGALNQEQHNENNDPQTTSGIPASGMSETALIERSVRVIDEVSAAGSSAFPDEQLNTKLEDHEMQDHNRVIDKDTSSL